MDLIGEIIEREIEPPKLPEPVVQPDPSSFKKSKFAALRAKRDKLQRPEAKKLDNVSSINHALPNDHREQLSESDKIHKENLDKLSKMTDEEIAEEQRQLMSTFDPQLLQNLIKRAEKRDQTKQQDVKPQDDDSGHDHDHHHEHAEGYDGWIGGMKTAQGVKDLSNLQQDEVSKVLGLDNLTLNDQPPSKNLDGTKKKVTFNEVATVKYEDLPETAEIDESAWEDVEDINDLMVNSNAMNEVAPEDYQLVNDNDEQEEIYDEVHFPKPKAKPEELDINDPEFYDKLHEKYYPDLPKETSKLAWMTKPLPQQRSTTYESISDMRFDFQGNLIELKPSSDPDNDVPTYLGLHHHSENPHLPGYTLKELAHLSRSTVPGQRCLSIQMLGRILHKLGLHQYNILPIEDNQDNKDNRDFNHNIQMVVREFEKMMWDVIENLRIIEIIEDAADDKTKNLSVRNYAIEALWLWKQGGGKPEFTEDDEISKLM